MHLKDSAEALLTFWFSERVKPLWFNSTPTFDQEIREQYQTLWQQAQKGLLNDWLENPESA